MRASSVLPAPDQNPYDAVRFLKKRHYFTQHGVIVAAHAKYGEELVALSDLGGCKPKPTPDMAQWSGSDEELKNWIHKKLTDSVLPWVRFCTFQLIGGTSNTVSAIWPSGWRNLRDLQRLEFGM